MEYVIRIWKERARKKKEIKKELASVRANKRQRGTDDDGANRLFQSEDRSQKNVTVFDKIEWQSAILHRVDGVYICRESRFQSPVVCVHCSIVSLDVI